MVSHTTWLQYLARRFEYSGVQLSISHHSILHSLGIGERLQFAFICSVRPCCVRQIFVCLLMEIEFDDYNGVGDVSPRVNSCNALERCDVTIWNRTKSKCDLIDLGANTTVLGKILEDGNPDGSLIVMKVEFGLPTPIPTQRETYFLRRSRKVNDHIWLTFRYPLFEVL
ncbi:hypothetical protein L6452_24146 [Arctium lappa]|uniref:Uncharacterized protein n=1 Tax=Arctium lappa TaxID=4217 RepID=A0ACB9A891_ARCLA|nr:hypothetical protein L6452_24146 [Arctium lappa]